MTTTTINAERRDRIERLVKLGFVDLRKFEDYTKLPGGEWGYAKLVENGGSGSYGDFKGDHDVADFAELADDEDLYVFSRYTGYSDYSGSTVEASNCAELHEQFDGVAISVYGGHNTTDVCFSLRWILNDDAADTLLDIFEGLEDYPLINDEALSELESEYIDEAWSNWAASDFSRGIEKALDVELNDIPDSDLRRLFDDCAELANEYWYNEGSGTDMYISVDDVVAEVTVDMVREWVPVMRVRVFRDGFPYVDGDAQCGEYTADSPLYGDDFDACMEAHDNGEESLNIDGHEFTWTIE
jgi:hypothetical protein